MYISQPYQTTVSTSVTRSGIGLHSARLVDVTIRPAPADTGIVFRRTDVSSVDTAIKALSSNIADTMLNSRIMNDDGVDIGTIEHLMAAFAGLGVDNAFVDVNAAELPAMDGSSAPFCAMINDAGIDVLKAKRKYIKVLKPIRIAHGTATAEIIPADRLEIDITIDFDDPLIGKSQYFYIHTDESFVKELSAARTFCRYGDLAKMRAAGYALGGSLDNAIVVNDGVLMNEQGLRFTDEFVRHKTLDCIGDLSLAGLQVIGHITAVQPGHAVNHMLLEAILADESAWMVVEADELDNALSLQYQPESAVAYA